MSRVNKFFNIPSAKYSNAELLYEMSKDHSKISSATRRYRYFARYANPAMKVVSGIEIFACTVRARKGDNPYDYTSRRGGRFFGKVDVKEGGGRRNVFTATRH